MKNLITHICSPGNMLSKDIGLLFLRIGIGSLFFSFGIEKIMAGAARWHWLGSQMNHVGINWAPVFWGLLAVCAEFIGGFLFIIGYKTRLAAFFIAIVMIVAIIMHLKKSDTLTAASFPFSLLITVTALGIMGSGRFSIDYLIAKMWC